jgi:Asp-tRNA(Asn)/Glu-tRNA(Gln) amidotransferase A subunit family amidase
VNFRQHTTFDPLQPLESDMAMRALIDLTAAEAREEMASGRITAEAYMRACLDQIERREKDVDAWVHLDPENALAQARAADRQRASGAGIGALHGLPVGIKDIINTADMPTQNGSPIFKGFQPAEDATCVAELRAAGAIIIGKTVTTELANTTPNKTRNPHNPAHTPGGSSSGSAAAVAARMIPLALGTQTGGSVIRPGSFCGVHALKPTLGLISRTGVTLQSHTLDTVGVYGRSIEDLALITDALSHYDPSDSVSYQRVRPSIRATLAERVAAKPRFAFFRSPAWSQAEPAARTAIEAFVASLGPQAVEVSIPEMDGIVEHHASVMGAENAAYYGPLLERYKDAISKGLAARLETGAKVPGHAYVRALNAREDAYRAVSRVLDAHSAILTLSSCGPAPVTLNSTGNAIFNGMWTLLGVPCVSLPLLTVDGLPLGVQLIGKRRDEGRLLAAARWLEDRAAHKS